MGIKRLKTGKYQLTYTFDGFKKRLSFLTKKEAEVFLLNVKARKFTAHVESRMRISPAIEFYAESRSKLTKMNHVYSMAFSRLEDHLLNDRRASLVFIDEVTRPHVLQLRERLAKIPLSGSTVNLYTRIYRAFFVYCLDMDWIKVNPCSNLKPYAMEHKKKKLWQVWQQQKLVESFSGWMHESLYFFWLTGIRPTSIFRLKWKDFDCDRCQVNAVSFKSRGGSSVESTHYLSDDLNIFLIQKRIRDSRIGLGRDDDFIFHERGEQRDATSFCQTAKYRIMQYQAEDDSFSGLTIYGFRHSYVSRMADQHGLSVASKAIGHKSIQTTEKFYYSENQEMIRQAVQDTSRVVEVDFSVVTGKTDTSGHFQKINKKGGLGHLG